MDELVAGRPYWLAASANEGSVDYFGFRFYRQPNRNLLVRGAAANNFTNAKTLIYFAAITYAFRTEYQINIEADLSEKQLDEWNEFYKAANYLYIVNCFAMHKELPDSGFTGASDEWGYNFSSFYNDPSGNYDMTLALKRMYPQQRQWGYLQQFWQAPLLYFRCVVRIALCIPGEYAEDCYNLLRQYDSWDSFVNILKSRKLRNAELKSIQEIIDCKELSSDEQKLAQQILFDEKNVTDGENDNYKINYRLLKNLKDNGLEGFFPEANEDYFYLFSYAHLNQLDVGQNDMCWKIILSSLNFEIGINRLYTIIAEELTNGIVSSEAIKRRIDSETINWIAKNGFDGQLGDVVQSWQQRYSSNIFDYKSISEQIMNNNDTNHFIDGLLQGYIISKLQLPDAFVGSDAYYRLTDPYHHFIPQVFFMNKPIKETDDFVSFLQEIALGIIDEQFDFSLDRLGMGQKPKFILRKSEYREEYVSQVDKEVFKENRGIIDMIDSTTRLWQTAGVF